MVGADRRRLLLSVTKDTILAAIEEGAGAEAAKRIKGVSKAELARVAERELQGKRWLPKLAQEVESFVKAMQTPKTEHEQIAAGLLAQIEAQRKGRDTRGHTGGGLTLQCGSPHCSVLVPQ